ncbi:MAG: endolytic transglycosylase MltG [Butyrivibrio sp.]|nr:endolytic transglycosylase MltG [Butyrivibrio sp.]
MEGKKLAKTIVSVSSKTLLFVMLALVLYFVGRTAYRFGNDVFNERAMASKNNATEIEFTVPEDYTMKSIGKSLKSKGLIADEKVFAVQAKLSDYNNKLIPGTYTLNNAMTPTEILTTLGTKQTEEKESE